MAPGQEFVCTDRRHVSEPVGIRPIQAIDDSESPAAVGLDDDDRWHTFASRQSVELVARLPGKREARGFFQLPDFDLDELKDGAGDGAAALFEPGFDIRVVVTIQFSE